MLQNIDKYSKIKMFLRRIMKEEKEFLKQYIHENDVCVLALSGGPDSMCLLHLLLEIKAKIICVHINHGTRKTCKRDQEFVKEYLKKYEIPLEIAKIESYKNNRFKEEEARKFRYKKFQETMTKYHAKYLLTAHHGDDLTETILMRILRGSTLEGYAGIKRKSTWNDMILLRPLLTKRKKDIYEYLEEHKIPYMEDETNELDNIRRNRIRHHILPCLERETSNYHLKMLKFSEELSEKNDLINEIVEETRKTVEKDHRIEVKKFQTLSRNLQRAYIESYLKDIYGEELEYLTKKHINLFENSINSKRDCFCLSFPKNYLLIKQYGWCYLRLEEENKPFKIVLQEEVSLPNGDMVKKITEYQEKNNFEIHLNSQDIKLPLFITTRSDGMKMAVKNLNGHRKVNDILIDKKIPKEKRDQIPILIDTNGTVLWILGVSKSKYDLAKDENYDIIYKYIERKEL